MFIFYEFRPFCIDNARVIYRKIRYFVLRYNVPNRLHFGPSYMAGMFHFGPCAMHLANWKRLICTLPSRFVQVHMLCV